MFFYALTSITWQLSHIRVELYMLTLYRNFCKIFLIPYLMTLILGFLLYMMHPILNIFRVYMESDFRRKNIRTDIPVLKDSLGNPYLHFGVSADFWNTYIYNCQFFSANFSVWQCSSWIHIDIQRSQRSILFCTLCICSWYRRKL